MESREQRRRAVTINSLLDADHRCPARGDSLRGWRVHWRFGLIGSVQRWARGRRHSVVHMLSGLASHFGVEQAVCALPPCKGAQHPPSHHVLPPDTHPCSGSSAPLQQSCHCGGHQPLTCLPRLVNQARPNYHNVTYQVHNVQANLPAQLWEISAGTERAILDNCFKNVILGT